MWTVQKIRQTYLDFFVERGHRHVESWPLVPPDDPTLLFTNAGMVRFKPYYSGVVDVPFRRACSVQKCLRAGGKGSDLENVGKTIRHHTFFEMLGNFSFGDYFKREAIEWGWEFVAKVLELPRDRLYVTIFEEDDEAGEIWRDVVGFPAERIFKLGVKDNFWGPAGDTGACGPCTEIHYDMGPEFDGPDDPEAGINAGAERYLEFWNLVFPQFDQQKDGSRPRLKNRGIDTGMGLERMACILQGVSSPYETDEMKPIVDAACAAIGVNYRDSRTTMMSANVVADHVRALTFAINEGVLPSNEGRGYIIRRILRRAVRHAKKIGMDRPFLGELIDVVIDRMGEPYPELKKNPAHLKAAIGAEEERFRQTLNQGMDILEGILNDAGAGGTISGRETFRLYDTYGFPPEMTLEIAEENGQNVDMDGYQVALGEQKKRSRESVVFYQSADEAEAVTRLFEQQGYTKFVGYDPDMLSCDVKLLAAFKDGQALTELNEGDEALLALDCSPFYAEGGGQVGDVGKIASTGMTFTFEVSDTQKSWEGVYLHRGRVTQGRCDLVVPAHNLRQACDVRAEVDADSRMATMRHHTATHLLQAALKRVVGEHVTQSGSSVSPAGLRFDFTHLEGLTPAQLAAAETLVVEQIVRDLPVETQVLPLEEAKEMGAIAPFGEKYGATVRVVTVGDFSMEFCGGTHLERSSQIGPFIVTGESSIAAGVRRIEAQAGLVAARTILEERQALSRVCLNLSAAPGTALERLEALNAELREQRKEIQQLKQKQADDEIGDVLADVEDLGGVKVVVHQFSGLDVDQLRAAADVVKSKLESYVAVLGSGAEGKVSLICAVSPDLHDRIKAGDLIRPVAKIVNGGGGGRPDLAQAGGKDPAKLPEALARAREIIAEALDS